MAQTVSAVAQRQIPKQPECNIGTSGHVDHGKCLALDEYVVMGGRLTTGREILGSLEAKGLMIARVDGGVVYRLADNAVVALDEDLRPIRAGSLFYVQDYKGAVFKVTTGSGRSITVTPEHPLLVNRRGTLQWVKARELRDHDHVAFLATVPEFAEPSFIDPMARLAESYKVVKYEVYDHLRRVTNDFSDLVALTPFQLETVRILARVSTRRLSKLARTDPTKLHRVLGGRKRPTERLLSKLRSTLSTLAISAMQPGEFLAETRCGRWSSTKLRDVGLSDDLMKWFAFVWAEGTSVNARIAVAQTVQKRMLEEFLAISQREFGLSFKKVSDVDYHLNSKVLVDYLAAKYSYKAGNESICSIPDWVLGVPARMRSTFLRWFFTLDGEFNENSGQIMISQLNERNIVTIGYLLQAFGIVPRFSKSEHNTKKGRRSYPRLMISGRANLMRFKELIGFEDPRIQVKLSRYLSGIKFESKETDWSIPVDGSEIQNLLVKSCVLREGFRGRKLDTAKTASWYKAYSTSRRIGKISRSKLLAILKVADLRVREVERSMSYLDASPESLRLHMNLVRLTLAGCAQEIGVSRKVLTRLLKTNSRSDLSRLERVIRRATKSNIREARAVLNQLALLASSPIEFDRVRRIDVTYYDGKIFDLTVQDHANFIAGKGAIIAHNTSIVSAITGVWASAHSEELKRGITIKVGYADAAFYKCPDTPAPESYSTSPVCPACGKETKLLRAVSFVDCPGHESLMTNMLAGAALMDGAIMVIAANEPVPMPQTREHMLALQMLGMKNMVIVQNKIDRVDADGARKNYEAIKSFISNTIVADAPVIPVSAQHSVNIDALIEAIEQRIPTPKRDPNASSQMYVLRSFDVNKPGVDVSTLVGGVLGGSLVKGELHVGDEVEIGPGLPDERGTKYSPLITKVVSLGTGAGMTSKVGPGGLIALGTNLDPAVTKGDLMVGSLLGKPGSLPPLRSHITIDVQLFEQAVGGQGLVKVEKVRMGESLRLNVGTAASLGSVTSAREAVAELDLKKPVTAEQGARVAISRRIAERWRLIGSGVIR